jgi:hypothetical protein
MGTKKIDTAIIVFIWYAAHYLTKLNFDEVRQKKQIFNHQT